MTTVPIPTFVPQDSWYTLTTGNYNPSVADTVPNITYLQPSGDQDGIVGPLDGAVIGLAGTATTLDGGQKWLMWDEDSLEDDNGTTVFCPFVDDTTAGRWIALGSASRGPGTNTVETQTISAGTTDNVTAPTTTVKQVFVLGRLANAETLVNLPSSATTGWTINVKDAEGDSATYNVRVLGTIDGASEFVFYADYQSQNFTWNGTDWSAT